MTKYTLVDGSEIYINDDQICTKIENEDNEYVVEVIDTIFNIGK